MKNLIDLVLNRRKVKLLSPPLDLQMNVKMEHWRNGKLLGTYETHNGITEFGKNEILDVKFNDDTQIANNSWFIGLIDLSGFTALAPGDTSGAHTGWSEFSTYSEATRVAWGSGAASAQTTTNASPATFNITGSATVKGVFVISVSGKGTSTGELWATALFSSDVPVSSGDQLKVTYSVSA